MVSWCDGGGGKWEGIGTYFCSVDVELGIRECEGREESGAREELSLQHVEGADFANGVVVV